MIDTRDDSGVTLVETLVTATLLIVVIALVTTSYVTGIRTAGTSAARADATIAAADALGATTKALRTALTAADGSPALISATSKRVQFWAALETGQDKAPSKMTLSVDDTSRQLVSEVERDGVVHRRVLAAQVRNDNVFTYSSAVPDPLDACAPPTLEPLTQVPLSASDRAKVRVVDVSLTLTSPDSAAAPAVASSDRAFLVNATDDRTGGKAC